MASVSSPEGGVLAPADFLVDASADAPLPTTLSARLAALERSVRTRRGAVAATVVFLILSTGMVQAALDKHLWLCVTYAFPVALAAYGLGAGGGILAAGAATVLLAIHAHDHHLADDDMAFVVLSRLLSNLSIVALCSIAAATVRARERFIEQRRRVGQLQSDLVAAFAHDLRSPLNAIIGYASMLEDEEEHVAPSDDHGSALNRIQANARRVDQLICDMLSADSGSAETDLHIANFEPEALVASLRVEFDASSGPPVMWVVEPGTPAFSSDRSKLVSIVRNLVGNARKYARRGTVWVTIQLDVASETHRISVTDSGPGIPADALPHLFDRFYRVGSARDRDGFGLGLFIVKRLTDIIGGVVDVDSKIGHGTRFTVRVPRLAPSAKQAPTEAVAPMA
jgi:signal transduction histidine kinase